MKQVFIDNSLLSKLKHSLEKRWNTRMKSHIDQRQKKLGNIVKLRARKERIFTVIEDGIYDADSSKERLRKVDELLVVSINEKRINT